MFNQETKVYVVKNTAAEKSLGVIRTGEYLLIFERPVECTDPDCGLETTKVLAFGLSANDAIRAQKNGAIFLGMKDAENLINRIED